MGRGPKGLDRSTHRVLYSLHREYQANERSRPGCGGRRFIGMQEAYLYLTRAVVTLMAADGREFRRFFEVGELELLERAANNRAAQREPARLMLPG